MRMVRVMCAVPSGSNVAESIRPADQTVLFLSEDLREVPGWLGVYWSWVVGNKAGAGEDGVGVGIDGSCIIEALGN
jgi:hypothetical protein